MTQTISEKLAIEEFNQLHQHMRQREEAMGHLLNVSVTGSTTILAAVAAYVFQLSTSGPAKLQAYHCYLFLSVMPVLIFGLAMLAAHRQDIYRMGYYINVFFEERWGGAEWGIRSFRFRELMRGESHDPVVLVFWSLLAAAAILFLFCLTYLREGLIDELHVAIAPALLGGGERLFEGVDLQALGYACVEFAASDKATHVVLRHQGRTDA